MAWLELHRTRTYHAVFRFGGAKFRRSLKTRNEREAKGRLARLEDNIRFVEGGLMALPEHGDVAAFLLSNGQFNGKPKLAPRLTLAQLIDRYCEALPADALEPESLRIARLHVKHFVRILGVRKCLGDLEPADLQKYVLRRSGEPGKRGKRISVGTIRKELATLNTLREMPSDAISSIGPHESGGGAAGTPSAFFLRATCGVRAGAIVRR